MDRIAIYALTLPGARLAARLAAALGADLFLPERLGEFEGARFFEKLGDQVAENFSRYEGHVLAASAGLVVRLIAPLLVSKKSDPAVVTIGADGRFAVSLLSGHLGGGNRLAQEVARLAGGEAVISTATDMAGAPALEVVARDLDMEIDDFAPLAAVSRTLVEGGRVKVYDPHQMLAPHLAPWPDCFEFNGPPPAPGEPWVRVDFRKSPADAQALTLRPKVIALGLGCHRGIEAAELEDFVKACLDEASMALESVSVLASVESRANEPALIELGRKLSRPVLIFTKDELAGVKTPNPSSKVLERIGVSSVCEAAAMLAARTNRLEILKKKSARATLAAALTVLK